MKHNAEGIPMEEFGQNATEAEVTIETVDESDDAGDTEGEE